MQRPRGVEVADVFRHHGPEYRLTHPLPLQHLRAMRAVEACRTAELGGHKDKCADCGHIEISYNSCRNRHCPKCQTLRKERWIEARGQDLLPVEYFHVVFTVPSELNPLFIMNPRVMFTLLFRSASETLVELADNPRHLGARIGFMVILHTWGQNLMDHPHVHCVVTEGGLSPDKHWVSCRKGFFLPVRVISALFRGKFLDYLKKSFENEDLIFPGGIGHLKDPRTFEVFRRRLYHKKWVVYCKPPFAGLKLDLNANFIDRWLTSEEEKLLLDAAAGKLFGLLPDIMLLDLHTGLSQEEILDLKKSQIDFFRRTLTVTRKKTKKKKKPTRTIPLNSIAIEILKRRVEAQEDSAYVFTNTAGNKIDAGKLKREFIAARKASKVPNFRFHDLRHTFATKLVQMGVDLYRVAKLLGHSDITVTERYAHHCPESLRSGVEILENRETAILEEPASEETAKADKVYHAFITPELKKVVEGFFYSPN